LLDGDDYWCSNNHLQSHLDVYNQNKHIGFIFGNFQLVEEATGVRTIGISSSFSFPINNQFEFSLINYPILTSTSSFKKNLVTPKDIADYIFHEFPTSDYGIYLGLMLKTKGYYIS